MTKVDPPLATRIKFDEHHWHLGVMLNRATLRSLAAAENDLDATGAT